MSTALKGVIVIIILGALAWLAWWSGWISMPRQQATTTQTATTTPAQQQPDQNGMSSPGDTSDAGITQDTAAIDAQMQGLSTDSTAVDSSLNDKPVMQSY